MSIYCLLTLTTGLKVKYYIVYKGISSVLCKTVKRKSHYDVNLSMLLLYLSLGTSRAN